MTDGYAAQIVQSLNAMTRTLDGIRVALQKIADAQAPKDSKAPKRG